MDHSTIASLLQFRGVQGKAPNKELWIQVLEDYGLTEAGSKPSRLKDVGSKGSVASLVGVH